MKWPKENQSVKGSLDSDSRVMLEPKEHSDSVADVFRVETGFRLAAEE